jgi:hypothetical protein
MLFHLPCQWSTRTTVPAAMPGVASPQRQTRSGRSSRGLCRRNMLLLGSCLLASMAQSATPLATSWEVAGQFNANTNSPQSLWQYGWKATPTSAVFNHFIDNLAGWPNSIIGWQMGTTSQAYPFAVQNKKIVPYAPYPTTLMPARGVTLHPGSGKVAVVRFKAPRAANYRVSGQFYAGNVDPALNPPFGTDTIAYLVSTLPTATVPTVRWSNHVAAASSQQASFSPTFVMLNTGDVLDFVVGPGEGDNFQYGSTGLHAVIEVAGCYRTPFDPPCDPQ